MAIAKCYEYWGTVTRVSLLTALCNYDNNNNNDDDDDDDNNNNNINNNSLFLGNQARLPSIHASAFSLDIKNKQKRKHREDIIFHLRRSRRKKKTANLFL